MSIPRAVSVSLIAFSGFLRRQHVGVEGASRRYFDGVAIEVAVKVLAPAADQNEVSEDIGFLHIPEYGKQQIKFFHGAPFLRL
jgi:hypothetical protein